MKTAYKTIVISCFLMLMASNHVHGGSIKSVVLTILPRSTVMNNTVVQVDCDYAPTTAVINTVVFIADTNAVYIYEEKPTLKNESSGVFLGRAQMASLVNGKFRVTVDPVTTKDKLQMQCQVFGSSASDNKISMGKMLEVNAIPQMISFTASPELPVAEKSTVTLICGVNLGKPAGTIKWKKDVAGTVTELTGVEVNETDNGDNTKTRFEKYEILDVKAEENGAVYKCEVTNSAITTETAPVSEITMVVHYNARNIQISHSGETVVTPEDITCTAEGNPPPVLSWVKVSGEDLKSTAGVLHVPKSTYNGTYKYQCLAKNTVDGDEKVLNETKEFSVFGYCQITTATQKLYVTENSTATIMCKINGTERPIWSKDGAKKTFDCESQDSKFSVACVKQKYYNLTFTPNWSYRGKYSCECHLEKKYIVVGVTVSPRSVRASCKVNIGEPSEKHCIDTQITSNDNLTITTEVSCAHPVPTIKWKNGGSEIDISVFDPVTLPTECSHGAFQGQTSVSQVFHVKWKELGSPQALTLVVANDAKTTTLQLKISGGLKVLDTTIPDPESPDGSAKDSNSWFRGLRLTIKWCLILLQETSLTTGEIAAAAAGVLVAVALIIAVIVVTTKAKCAASTTTKDKNGVRSSLITENKEPNTFETFKAEHKLVANNKNMVDIIRKPYPEPVIEKPPPSPDEDSEKYEMSPLTNPE